MNTVTNTVIDAAVMDASDGLTVSMVEVDAAAARAALTDRLQLAQVDLEHPAAVAVLAAVVAAGWRPPTSPGDSRRVTIPAEDRDAPALFGDDFAEIAGARGGPPGRPR